ncbi:hypothetical protein [Pseudooceanicola sp.]|uniref:hypothetical protein n=1 Tax=Pseudooceanicola sp. TaxID=1914328 RepID=UPI00262E3E3B|nr:hypothetical protein [Pseudooceanicola sp.]
MRVSALNLARTCRVYASPAFLVFTFSTPIFGTNLKAIFLFFATATLLTVKPSLSKAEFKWLFVALIAFTPSLLIDFYFLAHGYNINLSGAFLILSVLFSILLAHRISTSEFLLRYANLVTFLTIISTLLYLLVRAQPALLNFAIGYTYYDFPGQSFVVQNFIILDHSAVFRNSGFASEPGVFQMFINSAIAIYFYYQRVTLLRLLILTTGVFTTMSTAGFITFFALLIIASPVRYRALVFIIAVVASSQLGNLAADQYQRKILSEHAFAARYEPIVNAIDVIAQYPFGFGSIRYSQNLEILNIGSHDSYTQATMRFGIQGLILFIVLLLRLIKRRSWIVLVLALGATTNNIFMFPALLLFLFVDWKRPQTAKVH